MSGIYRIDPKEGNFSTDQDQLNKMISVTSPPLWLILLGGMMIVVVVLVWSCTGWMTETVNAAGIYHPMSSDQGEVIALLPLSSGKTINPGMEVTVYANGYNQQEYGHMKAVVTYVDDYVTSIEEMQALLESDTLVNIYAQSGPLVAVICRLQEDGETQNGYYWSSPLGGDVILHDGTYMNLSIEISRFRPITKEIPALEKYLADS